MSCAQNEEYLVPIQSKNLILAIMMYCSEQVDAICDRVKVFASEFQDAKVEARKIEHHCMPSR